ncbi:recombinase family protein [Archangium sp. Cb G35]|uniref:recombinase family protein n=1 Tax=Archangium sp. Cb G35 TaxID=1920190 RepID=UPI0009F90A94|nr:recombinase family protein [Archangium sp. Cb G35]
MRVACYLRVSTDEQTVENQRAPLEQLARARDWEPVWYEETWSGRDDRRPQLQKLLEDCRKGRVQAVAVVALDRLTRRVKTLLRMFEDFDRWGARVVSIRESWTDLPANLRDLVVHVLGFCAEMEVANLRERTRAGMRRAKEKGTKTGRPIGRPRLSRTQLAGAVELVQGGASLRQASRDTGVSVRAIRRRLDALAAPQNVEGPGEEGSPPLQAPGAAKGSTAASL